MLKKGFRIEFMEKHKVELLASAWDDLQEIFEYILLENSQEIAEKILDKIMKSLKKLETFPNSGIKVSDKKLERLEIRMVVSSPYLSFYRVFKDRVLIYHIVHGARKYGDLFKSYIKD
jgi:toxin ParE1/3/4